jgi:hypothetical protein
VVKFSEVRNTSEASKYACYWREVAGVKAASPDAVLTPARSLSNLRKFYHRCDLLYINTDF